MKRTKSVDEYVENSSVWREELRKLRKILRTSGLIEEVKWGAPCYTHNGKNVVGLGAYKSYFGLWFHQGALLNDENNVLINAQEGRTRALRQWRMTSANEILPAVITRYIKESIAHVDAGNAIKPERNKPVEIPPQLKNAMRREKGATAAFHNLRLGRQREFAEYISSAKRNETKTSRIKKILPMISAGIGLNDKYRS